MDTKTQLKKLHISLIPNTKKSRHQHGEDKVEEKKTELLLSNSVYTIKKNQRILTTPTQEKIIGESKKEALLELIKMLQNKEIELKDLEEIRRHENKIQIEKKNDLKEKTEKINHNSLATEIMIGRHFLTFQDTEEVLEYSDETNLYELCEPKIRAEIQYKTNYNCTTHLVNETLNTIRRTTYINRQSIAQNIEDIPLQNCIFNITTEETRPYTPSDIFLTKHPVIFKPREETLEENPISQFLNQITETPEDEALLRQIVGYCFYREMPFQNFFLLVGTGANGKSVYLNIVRAMLGIENVSNESLQDLSENRFAKASLYLKNSNIFGDLSSSALKDAGIIKLLTGGDIVTAEQKFKAGFQFKNYAKIIASCNEVPETPDMTEGFFRRAILVNFPKCFEGKEDRELTKKLTKPDILSGFFWEAITAFKTALEDNNLIKIQTISEKKSIYLTFSNSPFAFLENQLEYNPEEMLSTEEIYSKYKAFCKERKTPLKDERVFFQKLYKFFNHKVYKKRISHYDSSEKVTKEVREYMVMGVEWKTET